MAKVYWQQTFKRDGVVFKNAAISIYLAGTATAARVFDINDTLHDSAPQLYTDSAGFVKFSLDSEDFATGQLFDIVCQPNAACDTRNEIRLPSLMILNDTEGYRNFRNIFVQTSMPTEGMRENDLWFDADNDNEPYVYDGTNWVSRRDGSIATAATTANWSSVQDDDGHRPENDADVTAHQFAQSLGSIDSATVNFNGRNDRDDSAITVPEIATDGSAIDHTINTDGSADISFEWSWGGTESDIDGFVVYVRGSTSSTSYDFGTTPSEEITFYCRPDRRHFILKGVAANLYWTFGVSAYRVVDPDVDSSGAIATAVIQPSASGEDPYRSSANVAFAGNITGTVNDKSVSSVIYHDGSLIKRTDGTGVNADSLPESTARKWAGETGATVGADWGSNITKQPKMFRILSRGYSSTTHPIETGLYDEFNTRISIADRSYSVDVYDRATGVWDSHTDYDVFGDANNAATMASDLNNLNASKIVIIRTYDEPQKNRLTNDLPTAIYRCGGSRTIFASSNFKRRSAYILVGIPDIGEGNGIELYAGDVDSDANAWVETTITITSAGNIQLGVIKARDAVDISYADGTVVEDLKPAQVGADKTGDNTANNTIYVNDSDTQSSHAHSIHGTLDLYCPSDDYEIFRFYNPDDTYCGCFSVGSYDEILLTASVDVANRIRLYAPKGDLVLESDSGNATRLKAFGTGGVIYFSLSDFTIGLNNDNKEMIPESDNDISNGNSSYRWSDVYTVNQHTGDILFSDTHCAICGKPFKKDDNLIFIVKKIIRDKKTGKNEVDCVPIHLACASRRKIKCKK